jgi:hypothetical protein
MQVAASGGRCQIGSMATSLPGWAWLGGLVVVITGFVLWAVGTPLVVLSVWSFGAAVATAAWIVLRTALEDATLRRELPGYENYCRRTRFRLVPALW